MGFIDDVVYGPRDFRAARHRHDAIGATMIAAAHDGQMSADGMARRRRRVERNSFLKSND